MTTNTTPAAKNTGRAHARRAISWTTQIAHTRHHWWWYAAITWTGWVVSLLLYATGNLTGAILAAVAAVSLIVINTGKPRTWKVTIEAKNIRIQRPDHPRFTYERPLNRYKSFTVVDMPTGRHDQPQRAIALLSRRPLGTAQLLVLPYDENEADVIIQQLSDIVSYDAEAAFSRSDRVLSVAAQWLGIG